MALNLLAWTTGQRVYASQMITNINANLTDLDTRKANLVGDNFTGNVGFATASFAGALTFAVETIYTGLGIPPGSPPSGKVALYFDATPTPKYKTSAGAVYTIPALETANSWTAAQTLSGNGANLVFNTTTPQPRDIQWQTNSVLAWIQRVTNDARTGGDAGDNIGWNSRTDAGSSKAWVLYLERATSYVMLNGTTPTAPLDINGNTVRLRTSRTPASAGAAGNAGDICWDANYLYICIATNTWRRIAHATWP